MAGHLNPYYDQKLKPLIAALPDKPGVYQYIGTEGKIIYVGKAKNLRKRVASYFTKDQENTGKTRVLVKKIYDINYIVVDTELDALLLENNLIKKHQPRYNVMLKDDKTFPWICIKNERFPRVFSTRNPVKDGSVYFGPYANVKMMNTLLDLVRKIFKLRTCKYNLTRENIEQSKFRVCLEYHIGNCKGACEGLQSEQDYNESIRQIKKILKGDINGVLRRLKKQMNVHAENLEFEQAQVYKEKIETLEKYQSRSTVVNPSIKNADVVSFEEDEKTFCANYLRVINGAIVQSHTMELKKKLDEKTEELLAMAVTDFRQRFNSYAKEIILPTKIDVNFRDAKIIIPKRGDKKSLLDLSWRNVKYYRKNKDKQRQLVDPQRHTDRIMETMRRDLRMKEQPRHIECFDNSNMQGNYPVAAMAVFKDGKPEKKSYRHFNIKTVTGPDDYASMGEVIYRRYKRLKDESAPLPKLIIIDGGKGQLNAAVKSLEKINLRGKITVIGIAKRLEEIYFPGDSIPVYIDKKSESLKIIQRARDEAHRFGITHYRNRHKKSVSRTQLSDIKGIGKKTTDKLLGHFKSVKQIKNASKEELDKVIGHNKASIIYRYFH
ncbi:MAG: excinuclease ABC subunit UvrC [Bacteroidales bacterium]|nr:excinuclease ABC subunit UvrC [Bacteroidales bacterium]